MKKMAEDANDSLLHHKMDLSEWSEGYQHLENTQALYREMDADIQESLEGMRRRFETHREALSEQRQYIEQCREEARHEATAAIQKLLQVQARLENLSQNSYGVHLYGAKRACLDAIQSYRDILKLINSEPMEEGGSLEAAWKNLSDVSDAYSVAKVITDSVNALLSVTPAQAKAIQAYTGEIGNCYHVVNPILRGEVRWSDASEEVKQTINDLHEFLDVNVTKAPMRVWRGIKNNTELVNGKFPLDQYTDEQLVGQMLIDGAFVSTSTEEYACFPEPTKLVLNLPAGTHGAYVASISSSGDHEKEFLMDCNQAFRVTAVQRRNGIRYIYADSLRR